VVQRAPARFDRDRAAWAIARRALAVMTVAACAWAAAPAAAEAPQALPDDAALEAAGAVIGRIDIANGDVFDPSIPEEDRAVFRLANRLHVRTRERTLRALLLFRTGDPYSRAILDETERILRDQRYLYDADIRPVRLRDGVVDVVVRTRDVWTLRPSLNFSRRGGANTVGVGVQEENFLGRGKSLTFRRTRDVDRVSALFRYRDDNVLGRRARMELAYSDNSDGQLGAVAFDRPFYAFDARWRAGVRASSDDRVDPLYEAGEVRDRFRHREDVGEAWVGWSDGVVDGLVRRWSVGFTHEDHRFEDAPERPPALALPEDRTLAYPWVEYLRIRPGFVEARNLDRIARTEDLDLGRRWRVRVGRSATAFGADRDRTLAWADFRAGVAPGPRHVVLGGAFVSGRVADAGGAENVRAGGEVTWFARDFGRHRLFVRFRGEIAHRLDGEEQLLLGGEEGLRGYPLRYRDGDRLVLLTVEQRFYTDVHLFQLVRLGAAVFADVGQAWFAGEDFRPLRDLGFGLRLGSSRSSSASMVHVDVAFPLDGDESISRAQFLVTTHETF